MALILVSSPETCGDVQARVESTPCTPSTKTEPDSRGTSPRMTMLRGGLLGERVADAVFPKANGPGGFPPSPFIECADLIADQSGFVKRVMRHFGLRRHKFEYIEGAEPVQPRALSRSLTRSG